jgi:hypothetical protein
MAHFAKIDEKNIVEQVVVVDNEKLLDESQVENEFLGIQYLKSIFGETTNWVQTSYNHSMRGRMAYPGLVYNPELDVFMSQKKYPSWTYSEEVKDLIPPTPYPFDGNNYEWDEDNKVWVKY